MTNITLSDTEKELVERILSTGCVPVVVEVNISEFFTGRNILDIEKYVNSHNDKASKTYINKILKANK